MLAESKEPPIKIRTEFLASKFAIKLISLDSDKLSDILYDLFVLSRSKNKLQSTSTVFPPFKAYLHYFLRKNQVIKKSSSPLPYPYELKVILNLVALT